MPLTSQDIDDLENCISACDSFNPSDLDYEGFSHDCTRTLVKSRTSFIKDALAVCIAAYIKRGTKAEKMMKKMSAQGKNRLRRSMNQLMVHTGSAKGQTKDFVNLPRLAASFPDVVMAVAFTLGNERWKLFDNLPACLSFVGANAIIPNAWKS